MSLSIPGQAFVIEEQYALKYNDPDLWSIIFTREAHADLARPIWVAIVDLFILVNCPHHQALVVYHYSHVVAEDNAGQKSSATSRQHCSPTAQTSALHKQFSTPPAILTCHQTTGSLLTFFRSGSQSEIHPILSDQQVFLHRTKGTMEAANAMAASLPCILLANGHHGHVGRSWNPTNLP